MSEYSKEKLYFLKLPKDFFQGYKMRALEGVPNGKEYELMYLKLLCEAITHNGYLRFDEQTPYAVEMIAGITNTNIDTVRVGMNILQQFGLVEISDTETIYLPEVPVLTGTTTEGAQKKQMQMRRRARGGTEAEKIPPRDIRQLDNGMSTNVSIPTERLEDSSESNVRKKVRQSKKQKLPHLLSLLVDSGFLEEHETEDPRWADMLNEFCDARKAELGDKDGFVRAKQTVEYVLRSISHYCKVGDDRNGKPIFNYVIDEEAMESIGHKFTWFRAALDRAVNQLKSEPFADIEDNDDDEPF